MKNIKGRRISETTSLLSSIAEDYTIKGDLPISKCRQIGYWLGGFGSTMLGVFMGVYFTAFLLEVAKVGPTYVALIMLVGNCVKAFSDPIIGYLISQSPQTRFGKFAPWILVALPVYSTMYCFIWFVPPIESSMYKMMYYIVLYCIMNVSNACLVIPYVSCVIAMSSCQKQRDSLVVGRVVFGALGSACAMVLYTIFNFFGTQYGWDHKTAYFLIGMINGVVMLLAGFITFMSIEERFTLNHGRGKWGPIFKPYFNVLKFKPYRILLCSILFAFLAQQMAISNFPLFFKYVLDAENMFPICSVIIMVSSGSSLLFWKFVAKKIGKKSTLITGTTLFMILVWSLLFIQYNFAVVVILCVLFGCLGGCVVGIIPSSMMPDVIAAYNLKNGHGDEAMFFSITFFIETVTWAICSPLSTLVLEAAGYAITNERQPLSVALALRLIVGVFPVLCALIALISVLEYTITEKARVSMHSVIKDSMSSLYTKT